MRMKERAFAVATVMTLGLFAGVPGAQAEDTIFVPLLTYRTGAFSGSGTPIANGQHDYLTLLNERDGGIGGTKIVVEECETGYDTKKGVECYESLKGKNPAVINPNSTGITLQLIPRAGVDKIPVLSMAYGLSAAADGNIFPWVFNPPLTYWDGASIFVKHVADVEGGFDKLKGKKLGLLYLDAPYGKEPIPLLESFAKDYGFELKLYPVAASELQSQSSTWLNVRRDRTDWIYLHGWGAMNPTAVQEAVKNNFPINHLVGVWWSGGDDDARPAGDGAKGYGALAFHAAGADFPALQDILKLVVAKGKSAVLSPDRVGEMLYNRGLFNAVLTAEAIRTAQNLTGKKAVTAEDVRRGLESLNVSAARLNEIGLPDFAAPVRVTCSDHSGHHRAYLAVWDGRKWTKGSDWIEPLTDKVIPLIQQDGQRYAASNPGWPKRSEPCDKSS
jgi:branched-chain amino acid transport system substrate-binding protein